MRYDVIIVGAGPAGAVLAWKLPQSMKVLVVDSRPLLDESRIHDEDKCCGGMLDHASQKELARLGLGLPKRVQMAPQIFTVRAIDFDSHSERYYQRNYLNIDRAEFDRWLLSLAEKRPNVTIRTEEKAILVKEDENAVFLTTRKGQERFTYEGRYLVGADGAASFVRHYLIRTHHLKLKEAKVYASIQEWHPVKTPPPYYGAMFDQKVTDYYSWIIPKTVGKGQSLPPGGYMLLGSAIPAGTADSSLSVRSGLSGVGDAEKASVNERFERLRQDMLSKGFDVSHPLKRQGALILRPRMFGSVFDGKGKVFLCGEAAGLISPSSSEGISFALRSGEALADSFAKADASEDADLDTGKMAQTNSGTNEASVREQYRKAIRPLRLSIALKSLKSPIMYQPIPRLTVFKTRALSMKVRKDTEKWGE
ncbi:MAG: FAD-dependent monooxygenase [Firmicutes bacterium]|nr:FAD-dependent monooxygenase [Bacillota bacterium]